MKKYVASIVFACLGALLVCLSDCTDPHAIADGELRKDNKSHPYRLYVMSLNDVINSEPAAIYFTELKKQCVELNAQRVLDDFQYCCIPLDTVVNQINGNITDSDDPVVVEEGFRTYCQNWPLIKGCVESLISGLSPCLGQKLNGTLVGLRDSVYAALSYGCEEDRWPELISHKGLQCKGDPVAYIHGCMTRKAIFQFFYLITIWWNPLHIRFNKSFCKYLHNIKMCSLSAYDLCKDQDHAFANFTSSLFDAVRNATQCRHYSF